MVGIPALVDFWSDKNGCSEVTEDTHGSGLHVVHDGCDGEVRVEHHRLSSGGHYWPESIDGLPAHRVIWDFVSEFRKP